MSDYEPLVRDAPIPAQVRHEVYQRAEGLCEHCADKGVDMHHLRYEIDNPLDKHHIDRLSIFGRETADDLLLLCRWCHRAAHRDWLGEYWIDPEEMEAHWASTMEEIETG